MTERYRILIVEDSPEDQNVLRTYLCESEDCEYDFTCVDSGARGLHEFENRAFDCVLLDYHLPDMDGIRVLERMSQIRGLDLPIVMVTGRGDEKLAVSALKRGAADYIVKSHLTPENLFRATHNAIEKHKSYQKNLRLEAERERAMRSELEAMREIRREKDRLQGFFEQMPTPIALLRSSGLVLEFMNEPMRKLLFGAAEAKHSLISLEQALGADIAKIARLVYTSSKPFRADEFELEISSSGEATHFFNLALEPHRSREGETEGVILMLVDVTDLVHARHRIEESELRAKSSEDRFRQIAEIIPHMIWVTNSEGNTEYLNQAWYSYTGSELADNQGLGWLNFIHPEDRDSVTKQWRSALKTGRDYEVSYRMLRAADGEYRWHIARGMALKNPDGQIEKWYGSNADIHDQRALTEDLKTSEQRLSLATQASRVGIWETDETGLQFWRNAEYDRALGLQVGEQLTIRESLKNVLQEDRGPLEKLIFHSLETRKGFDFEFRVITHEQTLRWVHIRGGIDRSVVGQERLSGTVVDMKDRKRRETDLQDAKNLAEAANQTKSAFLANMSHEIRTPLNAIIGFTDLIASDGIEPGERQSYAETVQRNGRALMQIIDDILDFSKIEAGRLELEIGSTDLQALVADIRVLFAPLAQAKGLSFHVSIEQELPRFVISDATRLRQILMNAVSNAIKFTNQGQVCLSVGKSGGAQSWLTFSVIDTGIGISEEQQARLFQAFSQADVSMTRRFGGTGLGLMLSRRLAKLLGGAYYLAKTRAGEGSTFELRVPLIPENRDDSIKKETSARLASLRSQRLIDVRVLVVDDSADSRTVTRLYLERQAASVTEADSALEALQILSESNFDIIITDIQMPEMDGLEFTRKLRKNGYAKPIIGLSAHVFREDRVRSLEAGINSHIGKPVKSIELVDAVESAIEDPIAEQSGVPGTIAGSMASP